MKTTNANFQFVCNLLATNIKPIEQISESCDEQIEILKPSVTTEKDKDTIHALFEEKKRIVKVYSALNSLLLQGNVLLAILVKWDDSGKPGVFDSARKSYDTKEINHYKECLPNAIDVDDLPKAHTYLESLLELLNSALHEKLINTIMGKSQAEIFLQDLKMAMATEKLPEKVNDEEPQANFAKVTMFKAAPVSAVASKASSSASPK